MPNTDDSRVAYALFRFGFGVNLAVHGLNRILGGTSKFATKLSSDFAATVLPRFAVLSFGYALPFAELLVGVLMLVGLWLRAALVAGSLLMTALMLGTALKGDWDVLGTQLLYAFAYYLLISKRSDDTWSLDARRSRRPVAS